MCNAAIRKVNNAYTYISSRHNAPITTPILDTRAGDVTNIPIQILFDRYTDIGRSRHTTTTTLLCHTYDILYIPQLEGEEEIAQYADDGEAGNAFYNGGRKVGCINKMGKGPDLIRGMRDDDH